MRRHPPRQDLMAYAEALVAGSVIPSGTARHVADCPSCSTELAEIRASLQFMADAAPLEVPSGLTASILAGARAEMALQRKTRRRWRAVHVAAKGLAFAAGLVVVTAISFRAGIRDEGASLTIKPPPPVQQTADNKPTPEELRRTAAQVQAFAEAVTAVKLEPGSLDEWRYASTVMALDADLSAVRAALESYPACERANRLMRSNLQRQAKALKSLYVEQSL